MLDKTNSRTTRTDLTEAELTTLIRVRDELASGAISDDSFDMNQIGCGTRACIGGWMAVFMGMTEEKEIFAFVDEWQRETFRPLFFPTNDAFHFAKPADGVAAINNFLMGDKDPWEFFPVITARS